MSKFRSNTRDIAPERKAKPPVKPGTLDEHHIGVFDHKGNARGHVGPKATAAVVSRFTGTADNHLGKRNGKPAWIGGKPKGPNKNAVAQAVKVAQSRRTDKGSVGKTLAEVSAEGATTFSGGKP
jgi:hypothetical protein